MGRGDDRGGERMLAAGLERRHEVEQSIALPARQDMDRGDVRPAEGERAGLVEDHRVDTVGAFERLATADEDARPPRPCRSRP